jgi:hypothetical protein
LGVAYQNSVNIVSTAENSALRIGYTNVNMTGIVPNSYQNKNSFNINGSLSMFDNFIEVNSSLNFVDTYTKGRPQFGYGDNSQSQKFFQWGQRQLDMVRLQNYMNPDGTMRTWNRVSWDDGSPVYSDNPYWTAYKNWQDDDRIRVFGKSSLIVNITDYLRASGTVYLDTYTFNQRERVAKGSQAMSLYRQINRQATETNLEGKLDYNQSFGDFNVLAMLGGNVRNEQYSRFQGVTNGGLVIDGLYNLTNSANQPLLEDYKREIIIKSIFLSGSVGYKDLAYIDATYRRDYDSTLPDGNNEYGYSSVSASVILSELIEVEAINNLKLRANYGETGMGTGVYQVYNTYTIS